MKQIIQEGDTVSIVPHGKNDIMILTKEDIKNLELFDTWYRIKLIKKK